jgi:hypothetical protein
LDLRFKKNRENSRKEDTKENLANSVSSNCRMSSVNHSELEDEMIEHKNRGMSNYTNSKRLRKESVKLDDFQIKYTIHVSIASNS